MYGKRISAIIVFLFLVNLPIHVKCMGEEGRIKILLDRAKHLSPTSGQQAIQYADSVINLEADKKRLNYTMEAMKIKIQTYLYLGDYRRCVETSTRLLQISEQYNEKDNIYRLYSYIGLGQANLMQDNYKEAKTDLDSALIIAIRQKNDSALCSVYNGLGLYHTNVDGNYYRAIDYYLVGIEHARKSSYERLYSLLLCNLSGVYYMKNDISGMKYAKECYNRGLELKQSYLIFIGASNTAYFYSLQGQYSEAMNYLKKAEEVMLDKKYYNQANLYNLQANIYLAQQKYEDAIYYFNKALTESIQTQTSSIADAYLGLGKVEIARRNYNSALSFLIKGLDLITAKQNAVHRRDLYFNISLCYEYQGKTKEGLDFYKLYNQENERLFNMDKEYALSELQIKYETELKENLLKEKEIELMTKEQHLVLLYIIIVFIVAICLTLFVLYRRRNKRYLQIVRQNLDFVENEKLLKQSFAEAPPTPDLMENYTNNDRDTEKSKKGETIGEKYSLSALTDEKSEILYIKLHKLMMVQKVYTDNALTQEKLAAILQTNRSYLSQVINKHARMSFSHYINKLRIEEARRILSDPTDGTPIKAISSMVGFNSLSTFYTAFQSIIGMSPSSYRVKMFEIYRKENEG